MKCKICGSENCEIEYDGIIRDGGLGKYTKNNVKMFRCNVCGVIWHNPIKINEQYYESKEYRESMEGSVEEALFYKLHDKDNLEKFKYTGTGIFRNSIVADIGTGCGSFLDFLYGVAKKIIAVEPSETYRQILSSKNFETYGYAKEAMNKNKGQVDVITSFDVIEHVENPIEFVKDYYELLNEQGIGIIGTPTDAPIMRKALGGIYEKKQLFSTQHLWIFNEKSLRIISEKAGFKKISIRYFQRYGIENFIGWMSNKESNSDIILPELSGAIDGAWKSELENKGLSDYIVVYLRK